MALHEGGVALVDGALLERVLERGVGALALGHDHQPGRAGVEAVHDALPLGRAGGRDPVARRQPARRSRSARSSPGSGGRRRRPACRPPPGRRRRRRSAGRAPARSTPARRGRLRQRHLEPRAGRYPGGLDRRLAIDQDRAGVDQVGRRGARKAEQPGQRDIEAQPVEPVGHRHSPRVAHRREPSRSIPRVTSTTASRPPMTIAESARLNTGQCGN